LSVIAFVAITALPCIHISASDTAFIGKTTYVFSLAKGWNSSCQSLLIRTAL